MDEQIPLYAETDYGPARELSLDEYQPDIWDAMRGGFQEGLKYLPLAAMENWSETNAQYARHADFAGMTAEEAIDLGLEGKGLPDWHEKMPLDKQKEYIERMGLTGQVQPHAEMETRALKYICEGIQQDNSLAELRRNMGWQHMPFSLAAGFAAGLLDPLAVASAFVPAIPEQRVLHMLAAQAHSRLGRAGVRAVQGAANGMAGIALLEPMIAAGSASMQRDYDLSMSLCNLAFGGCLGAALHPVAGHVSEWLTRRNGGWLPWELGVATAASEKLRVDNEKLFEEVRLAARPDQDRVAVQREAKADALTWDAHMRHIAFTEGIATEEAYARNAFNMVNAERFRQENAAARAEIARWTREVEEQEDLRRMREQLPDLRIADDLDNARERLEFWQAMQMESGRNAERDLEALFTGDTLYARRGAAEENLRPGTIGEEWRGAANSIGGEPELSPPSSAMLAGMHPRTDIPAEPNAAGALFQFARPSRPGQTPAIMGATTFPVDGRAIVRIFEAHDLTTISHELAHVLRRQYQRLAASPNASTALKRQYQNMERAFGVDEGGAWNVQAEEMFAEAYVRYMLTGKAPSAAMAQSFAIMREQGAALYADADKAGVNISTEMRALFDNMLTTPMEKGDRLLREAVADLATRRWEREFLPAAAGPRKPGDAVGFANDPSPALHAMEQEGKSLEEVCGLGRAEAEELEYLQHSTQEILAASDRALELDSSLTPEQKERIRREWQEEMDAIDREAGDIAEQGKAMEEYIYCLLRQ